MLSYRHAYHAGNHADVLKHLILVHLLDHLAAKDKPFWVIDTHAGAGRYQLDEGFAARQREFADGIGRLWAADGLPAALGGYLELVRDCNAAGELRVYPGSPLIARQRLRKQDRLWLCELHPSDYAALERVFLGDRQQVGLRAADGFAALKSLLPPAPRRALVLLDPPYEVRGDYRRLVDALSDALRRFATGCYMVWYPLIPRPEPAALARSLKALPAKSWLHAVLRVSAAPADGPGLYGSGVFVINPPHTLPAALQQALPELARRLMQGEGAGFELDFEIP